jgi:hypothetical protein
MDDHLRAELLAMQDEDQRLRRQAMGVDGEPAAAAWSAVGEADRRHTARMREIVAEHGWPGRTLVGEDGAHAAWLLAGAVLAGSAVHAARQPDVLALGAGDPGPCQALRDQLAQPKRCNITHFRRVGAFGARDG